MHKLCADPRLCWLHIPHCWTGLGSAVGNFLATDASLTADLGAASLISARSHTFVEIDYEIISVVILLSSPESFKKDCCQLQVKVCAQSTGWLTACSSLPRK